MPYATVVAMTTLDTILLINLRIIQFPEKKYGSATTFGLILRKALILPPTSTRNSLHCLQTPPPPSRSRLHRIFNKQNIKLSYSCLPNIKALLPYTTRISSMNYHRRRASHFSVTAGISPTACLTGSVAIRKIAPLQSVHRNTGQ